MPSEPASSPGDSQNRAAHQPAAQPVKEAAGHGSPGTRRAKRARPESELDDDVDPRNWDVIRREWLPPRGADPNKPCWERTR